MSCLWAFDKYLEIIHVTSKCNSLLPKHFIDIDKYTFRYYA